MKPTELLAGLPVTAVMGALPDGQEITGITKDSREVGTGLRVLRDPVEQGLPR